MRQLPLAATDHIIRCPNHQSVDTTMRCPKCARIFWEHQAALAKESR